MLDVEGGRCELGVGGGTPPYGRRQATTGTCTYVQVVSSSSEEFRCKNEIDMFGLAAGTNDASTYYG